MPKKNPMGMFNAFMANKTPRMATRPAQQRAQIKGAGADHPLMRMAGGLAARAQGARDVQQRASAARSSIAGRVAGAQRKAAQRGRGR